jgi:hypothetical protein
LRKTRTSAVLLVEELISTATKYMAINPIKKAIMMPKFLQT